MRTVITARTSGELFVYVNDAVGRPFWRDVFYANNRGTAVKKREDTHKMAEANRAFSHYRW